MTLLHQAAQKAVEALKFICEREDFTFAECSVAEEICDRARSAVASLESALQQQPEPVAHAPQRMTESEIHAHSWWCPHCRKDVPPEMVTKDGEHYLESGGCGYAVRAEPALQHQEVPCGNTPYDEGPFTIATDGGQEVPREPVAPFGWVWLEDGEWQFAKAFSGRPPDDVKPLYASPSTTRQQEVGKVCVCDELGFKCKWCALKDMRLAAAPSTPEKAGGVSPENQYFGDLMILQVLADSDCPNDQEREVLLRWIEHSQPPGSPIPHPLPAQANDGGEHG